MADAFLNQLGIRDTHISANPHQILNTLRLPARLTADQAAKLLGFQAHDVPVLVKAQLLKPLGGGPRNCVKFFAAVYIEQKRQDQKWLDQATKAVSRSRRSPRHVESPVKEEVV